MFFVCNSAQEMRRFSLGDGAIPHMLLRHKLPSTTKAASTKTAAAGYYD